MFLHDNSNQQIKKMSQFNLYPDHEPHILKTGCIQKTLFI